MQCSREQDNLQSVLLFLSLNTMTKVSHLEDPAVSRAFPTPFVRNGDETKGISFLKPLKSWIWFHSRIGGFPLEIPDQENPEVRPLPSAKLRIILWPIFLLLINTIRQGALHAAGYDTRILVSVALNSTNGVTESVSLAALFGGSIISSTLIYWNLVGLGPCISTFAAGMTSLVTEGTHLLR